MSKQPTVLLPSGQTCRPLRLRSIYRGIRELRGYDETYKTVSRISGNSGESAGQLWERNPYVVSSVCPPDLAEYDPAKHPAITRKRGQTWREAARDALGD